MIDYLQFKTVSAFFWKAALFVFYSWNPDIVLSKSKPVVFYCANFLNFKKRWHGCKFQLFGYKTAKKLSELEPQVSRSFDIK